VSGSYMLLITAPVATAVSRSIMPFATAPATQHVIQRNS
jgi:hypothetical protein